MTLSRNKAVAAAAFATCATIALWAASSVAQNAAGPFTQAQVDAGRNAYVENCQACHTDNLSGSGEALPIAGQAFMVSWASKSTKDLFDKIHTDMPYGAGGSLDVPTYTNLAAFLLHANGAKAGTAALTPTTAVKISAIASGTVPPDVANGVKKVAQAAAPVAAAPAARPAAGAAPAAPALASRADGAGGRFTVNRALGLLVPGSIKNFSPVTDDVLTHPSDNDWLMYRGGYAGWSFSKLNQITPDNVKNLQLKWLWTLNDGASQETTPVVHDGILYIVSAGNTVQALDAKSGELLWENRLGPLPRNDEPGGASDPTRSIGLYNDKVIVPTPDAKLYGLDAKTGKTVWQTMIAEPEKDGIGGNTGGVIIIHGKAIVGLVGCGRIPQKNHCYISAYDANTGARVWKFVTVADAGTPGGDTWNNLPNEKRAGTETWIAGTYDPVLNTTFWGTAQAKPWRRDLRGSGDGDTLYANSTLALDPDTGKLKWYFNHAPGESFDLDEVFERILIDHGSQKTVMTTGKAGILWKLDRETGKYLDSRQTVFQLVDTPIDPQPGRVNYRKDRLDQKMEQWLPSCPGPEGGKDWPAASYHQPSDTMILPLSQTCVMMLGSGSQMFYEMPGSSGNLGRVSAYETNTMKPLWSFQQRSPFLTGVLSTAGNVAFVGDFARVFRAVDVKSGKTLWTTKLGTTVQGHPITFSVDGKQYVAVTTGLGGGSPEEKPTFMLSEEVRRPSHGNALMVFGLPD